MDPQAEKDNYYQLLWNGFQAMTNNPNEETRLLIATNELINEYIGKFVFSEIDLLLFMLDLEIIPGPERAKVTLIQTIKLTYLPQGNSSQITPYSNIIN